MTEGKNFRDRWSRQISCMPWRQTVLQKKWACHFSSFFCIFVFVLSVFGEDKLIICVKCICICIISTCGLFARKCEETAIICRLARRCSREVRHIRHNRLQSIVNFLQPVDGRKGPSHIVLKCTQGLVIVINCARQQCLQHKETEQILDFHPFFNHPPV